MNTEEPTPTFKVGNLVTFNQDIYPFLGTWFVQLWEGEDVAARVYGDNHETLNRRIAMLNTVQPQQEPVLKQSWKMVPVEPTKEMLDAADDGDDSYTLRSFGPGVNRVMQGPEDHYAAMLAAAPQPPQRTPPQFPTALRKMWSGNEVQDWINANWNPIQQTKEPS